MFALIRQSKRPIIYAGGGVVMANAGPTLKAFVEKTGIPVALTVHGLGAFPSDHYLCLQMLGMHGTVYANYAINEADLLMALGVRFDDRVTVKVSEFAKHGKINHVDIDPSEINKIKQATAPICGDVGHALEEMVKMESTKTRRVSLWGAHGGAAGENPYTGWLHQIDKWRGRGADEVRRPRRRHRTARYAIQRL